jgi:hypothetical protein
VEFSKKIKVLFAELCCSYCKNDFTSDSFELVKKFSDIGIYNLRCQKCGKDFGQIVLKINQNSQNFEPLEIIEGAEPITVDDVIDIHNFLKNMK